MKLREVSILRKASSEDSNLHAIRKRRSSGRKMLQRDDCLKLLSIS
jgi:hypothetical protein